MSVNLQTDPLQEKRHEAIPGLIHKYENRVLCHLTYFCPSNCDFCFRKNLYEKTKKRASDQEIVSYIKNNPKIKEFIFSGGEPLVKTGELKDLAVNLSKLENIKIFRIHSRHPVTFPKNINFRDLETAIKETTQPWYFVIHVNSITELNNPETIKAILKLKKMGFILLSHTVFLKGINDTVKKLEKLFNKLVELGVKPYYIFHCDSMKHTQKFIIPIKKEVEIMTNLRKTLTGIAYPLHVIDSDSGEGKIPVPTEFWQCSLNSYQDFSSKENKI
jgi:lysine 2,3-aminomutase